MLSYDTRDGATRIGYILGDVFVVMLPSSLFGRYFCIEKLRRFSFGVILGAHRGVPTTADVRNGSNSVLGAPLR